MVNPVVLYCVVGLSYHTEDYALLWIVLKQPASRLRKDSRAAKLGHREAEKAEVLVASGETSSTAVCVVFGKSCHPLGLSFLACGVDINSACLSG